MQGEPRPFHFISPRPWSEGSGYCRPICRASWRRYSVRPKKTQALVKGPSVKEHQASARGHSKWGAASPASRRQQTAPGAAPRDGGSGGGAQTEAFPAGERSEAPREAPQERGQCAPSSSPPSLRCPAARPRSGLRAPAPASAFSRSPPRAFGIAASATLRASSTARAARRGAPAMPA